MNKIQQHEKLIMDAWNVADDLRAIADKLKADILTPADIADTAEMARGLATLYQHRFEKMFHNYEDLTEDWYALTASKK